MLLICSQALEDKGYRIAGFGDITSQDIFIETLRFQLDGDLNATGELDIKTRVLQCGILEKRAHLAEYRGSTKLHWIVFRIYPPIIELIYSQEYKIKMAACDGAMRGHLIAKNRVISEKSRDALDNLQMAEVALDCHEYDKLRKRLIGFGLSIMI